MATQSEKQYVTVVRINGEMSKEERDSFTAIYFQTRTEHQPWGAIDWVVSITHDGRILRIDITIEHFPDSEIEVSSRDEISTKIDEYCTEITINTQCFEQTKKDTPASNSLTIFKQKSGTLLQFAECIHIKIHGCVFTEDDILIVKKIFVDDPVKCGALKKIIGTSHFFNVDVLP